MNKFNYTYRILSTMLVQSKPQTKTMKHYFNVPIDIVPLLQNVTTNNDVTVFVSSSPGIIIRLNTLYEDGTYDSIQHVMYYDTDWESIETNLLFACESRDLVLSQIQSIVNWFRTDSNVYWVNLSWDCKLSVKGFLTGIPGGIDLEYNPPKAWDEPPFSDKTLNLCNPHFHNDSMKEVQRQRFLRNDISNSDSIIYIDTPDMITQSACDYKFIVAASTNFPRNDRDAILSMARNSSSFIIRTLSRFKKSYGVSPVKITHDGPGIGVISLRDLRRIVPKNFLREYVELDNRYPHIYSHVMRMQADPMIRFIVVDHCVDDVHTQMINEKVTPSYHTHQFTSIKNSLVTKALTKPIIICCDYPGLAKDMYAHGALVAPTAQSAEDQINKIVEIMLMNNMLQHKFEMEILDENVQDTDESE